MNDLNNITMLIIRAEYQKLLALELHSSIPIDVYESRLNHLISAMGAVPDDNLKKCLRFVHWTLGSEKFIDYCMFNILEYKKTGSCDAVRKFMKYDIWKV